MEIDVFRRMIEELTAEGKAQGGSLPLSRLKAAFGEGEVSKEQLALIDSYFKSKGIRITGEAGGEEESREGSRTENALPAEDFPGTRREMDAKDRAFLEEYLGMLPEALDESAEEEALSALAKGEEGAVRLLTSHYMREAAELAVKLNCEEMLFSDLLQETFLNLMMTIKNAGQVVRSREWILEETQKRMAGFLEDAVSRKAGDDSLVEQVRHLDAAMRELEDEEGGLKFTVEELSVLLDKEPEELRDIMNLLGENEAGDS